MERINFVISIPESFLGRFVGFLKNLNITNGESVIIVESVYKKDQVAAIPKILDERSGNDA